MGVTNLHTRGFKCSENTPRSHVGFLVGLAEQTGDANPHLKAKENVRGQQVPVAD